MCCGGSTGTSRPLFKSKKPLTYLNPIPFTKKLKLRKIII